MSKQLTWGSCAAIAILGLAVLLAVRPVYHSGTEVSSSALAGLGADAEIGKRPAPPYDHLQDRTGAAHAHEVRKVELNPNDCTELAWSVDELDEFLKTKSSKFTSKEMVSLLVYLLPAPIGAEASPSRLKPGSIQLRDQVRLCMKYLDTKGQQSLFSLFLSRYSKTIEDLDEYRRDAVGQMPPGAVRAGAMSGYFFYKYTNLSSIQELLDSDELPNLRGRGEVSQMDFDSDYAGAVIGVGSSLTNILERGDATAGEIIFALKASKLDETTKAKIIRQIEKRGAEVEILRSKVKANKEK